MPAKPEEAIPEDLPERYKAATSGIHYDTRIAHLESENLSLKAERDDFERKGKELCSAYGNSLITIHDLNATVARLGADVSDEGIWVIKFEDPDKPDEVFSGQGSSHAALERYRVCCYSWTCHLLIESNALLRARADGK